MPNSLILSDHAHPEGRTIEHLPDVPSLAQIVRRKSACLDMILSTREQVPGGLCLVIPADPSKPARTVTNLGWLLRHADDVRHPLQGLAFSVETWRYRPGGRGCLTTGDHAGRTIHAGPIPIDTFDPVLLAHMSDGRTYATQWASPNLLHTWLDRPSFRGYMVDWSTHAGNTPTCAIGGADYASISSAIQEGYARAARERYYRENPGAPWGSHPGADR